MNYLQLQVLILILFNIMKGVQTRFVNSVDLLTGGTACEVWKNRDYVSTLHFAAHIRREVTVAGSENFLRRPGNASSGLSHGGNGRGAGIPPRYYIGRELAKA